MKNRSKFPPSISCLSFLLLLLSCNTAKHQNEAPITGSVKLLPDLGNLHHTIKTSNIEAQRFFDQGLNLLFGFNFAEAIKSFRRAAEVDPQTPMPFWGLALALGPNYNEWRVGAEREEAARGAILTAERLCSQCPDNERDYINALAKAFSIDSNKDHDDFARDYASAMRQLSRKYPDDPDAAVLYASALMQLRPWQLWTISGAPTENTTEIVSVLSRVLMRWPAHIGANHLYIHALEGSPFPGRALPNAQRLATLAPLEGHLLHMPSHIYFRIGDYAGAVASNVMALAADEKYARAADIEGVTTFGYRSHNLYFLYFSAAMQGDFETSYNAAKNLAATKSHSDAFASTPLLTLMRFARWKDVLELPPPDDAMLGSRFLWHYARGCAFARTGAMKRAEDEREALEQVFAEIPPGRAFGMFFNDWATLHDIALNVLNARIAVSRKQDDRALALWSQSVKLEDQMNFDDLPDWYYPIRESLGARLLLNGRVTEAEEVFREDLARTPNNPRSLFGLWQALKLKGRARDADRVKQEFDSVWKGETGPKIEDF